jgi:DNA-binding transcriptional MerR regulator
MAGSGPWPIGEAARRSGLSPRRIRHYQSRGLVSPEVTAGGHRLFSAADIERLQRIAALLAQGLTLEEVANALEDPGGQRSELTLPEDLEAQGFEDVKLHFRLGRPGRLGGDRQ